MISIGRPPGNGRKKNLVLFSAMWKIGVMLLITTAAVEKALQFYVCPPECCSREYAWNRPSGDKDHGKKSLDVVDPAGIGQGCVINYAEMANCNQQDAQDAHEIVKVARGFDAGGETAKARYDDSDAFIRFVKKNHRDIEREFAKTMHVVKDIEEDGPTLHTECGDFKKVFVSGRWTFVAQT